MTDNEINSINYFDAFKTDKRSFFQYYLSLIRTKHLMFFAFSPKNDYNSGVIKFSFLIFTLGLFFAVNTLFLTENELHDRYISQGKLGLLYYKNIIFYSTSLSYILMRLLKAIGFTENIIYELKNNSQRNKKWISINEIYIDIATKCTVFYIIGILILFIYFGFILLQFMQFIQKCKFI